MKRRILIAAAILSFGASFVTSLHSAPEDRFDHTVQAMCIGCHVK